MNLSRPQISVVRKALGLGYREEAIRNSYASTQRLDVWEDLVAAGLAKSRIQRSIYGDPRIVYTATRRLAEAVLREDEYLNPIIFVGVE